MVIEYKYQIYIGCVMNVLNWYIYGTTRLIHNVGKNFISKKFKQYANTIGINIKGVLVKAHNFISMVEWYYKPL